MSNIIERIKAMKAEYDALESDGAEIARKSMDSRSRIHSLRAKHSEATSALNSVIVHHNAMQDAEIADAQSELHALDEALSANYKLRVTASLAFNEAVFAESVRLLELMGRAVEDVAP